MKTRVLAAAVIVAALIFSGGNAIAARKITTVKGVLTITEQGKVMLKTTGDSGYYFDANSEAGKKILNICKTDKICVVRGVISGNRIVNAYYVNEGK